jgi:hypothetical protein
VPSKKLKTHPFLWESPPEDGPRQFMLVTPWPASSARLLPASMPAGMPLERTRTLPADFTAITRLGVGFEALRGRLRAIRLGLEPTYGHSVVGHGEPHRPGDAATPKNGIEAISIVFSAMRIRVHGFAKRIPRHAPSVSVMAVTRSKPKTDREQL